MQVDKSAGVISIVSEYDNLMWQRKKNIYVPQINLGSWQYIILVKAQLRLNEKKSYQHSSTPKLFLLFPGPKIDLHELR